MTVSPTASLELDAAIVRENEEDARRLAAIKIQSHARVRHPEMKFPRAAVSGLLVPHPESLFCRFAPPHPRGDGSSV